VIRAESVTKRYGENTVLRGVHFELRAGEVVGLVGPGGAGKTTLLKCLCGLVAPDEGRVLVGDADLAQLSGMALAAVRRSFGVLFQNNALFDFMNVADNVAFPLRQERAFQEVDIQSKVARDLQAVGLARASALLPNQLSGGMKKRVSLARAAIGRAPILLYDDPTAGLDPVTSSKIFRLVREIHDDGEHASLVVSHDVDRLKSICHRYVLLVDGAVHFEGSLEMALASNDRIVATFFRGLRAGRGTS
jgi:phospholipid/cholesterol/gamma-HCH transport system ATP-binding protein